MNTDRRNIAIVCDGVAYKPRDTSIFSIEKTGMQITIKGWNKSVGNVTVRIPFEMDKETSKEDR